MAARAGPTMEKHIRSGPANSAQAAIAWVASRGDDIVPVVGARNRGRLAETLDAVDAVLTDGQSARIAAAVPSGDVESLDALHWGACHGGRLDTASLLVEAGADVNWRGWDDLTPLGAAERSGAVELVAWLRENGAQPTG